MKLAETRGGLLSAVVAAAMVSSCGGSAKPAPTPECAINSDCLKYGPNLVCALNFCVKPCRYSLDCPNNERCIVLGAATDGGTPVVNDGGANAPTACEAPELTTCHYNSECSPLVCGIDLVCRNQCLTNVDCPGQGTNDPQVCTVNSHLCADPMTDKDYDPTTKDFRNPDGNVFTPFDGGPPANPDASTTQHHDAGNNKDAPPPPPACNPGLAGFHPSNLPAAFSIPAGLPTIVQSVNSTFDTDALAFATPIAADGGQPVAMTVTLSDGRSAAVILAKSYTLTVGYTLSITGQAPLIIAADSDLVIDGTIAATQSGTNSWFAGGAPGPSTNARGGICGLNACNGGGAPGGVSNATQQGSGGGAFCGNGGAGSIPSSDAGTPAAGGTAYGSPTLIPLVGGASSGSTNNIVGRLNHGGGAIELLAGGILTVTENGVINMSGGADPYAYAVGGGSGGGILLEAPTVNVKGALVANGASGASYSAAGVNGQVSLMAAVGGSNLGGNGSSATVINGGNGQASGTNFSGGGGGAGRIRINTGCGGALNANSSALISPGATTTCYTTGTLN
jgi:hypothetical protein